MIQQSDEEFRNINNANAIRDLVNSTPWKLIDSLLKENIKCIKVKMDDSDDPAVVMACVRQTDGIMFIYEVIQELIELGDKAASQAAE